MIDICQPQQGWRCNWALGQGQLTLSPSIFKDDSKFGPFTTEEFLNKFRIVFEDARS